MKKMIHWSFVLTLIISALAAFPASERVTLGEAMKKGPGRYVLKDASMSISSIPSTMEEYIAMRDRIAGEPMGGYALFVVAMIKYGENKDLGLKFFTIAMDKTSLATSEDSAGYKGYKPGGSAMYLVRQMDKAPYLGNIYIAGTGPENGYKLPVLPWVITFRQATVESDDTVKLYANTTSGNMARPISLKRNDKGIWKAKEYSSVFVGVSKQPQKSVSDDL